MHSQTAVLHNAQARCAGALYLVVIACGLSAELALRGPILGSAETILANLPAFRLSLVADIAMILADIALALIFYDLLKPVSEPLARATLVLRLTQAALIAFGLTLLAAVPRTLTTQPDTALLLAHLHALAYDIGLIFFGVNSLIMARLLCPTAAPFALSPMLAGSGLVYIAGGMTRLAAPQWTTTLEPAYLLCIVTETALALWLLLRARL